MKIPKTDLRLFTAILLCFLCTSSMATEDLLGWNALSNPVYAREGWSVKDACMAYEGEEFYLFFSAFYWTRGQERSHVVGVKTTDFRSFSEPLFIWDGQENGWTGLCSPDISRVDGQYVMTFNSWGDDHPNGKSNQLFYALSRDLESWSDYQPLASNLTIGSRAIDAALCQAKDKLYLVWKEHQTPMIAFSNELEGNWTRIGNPSGGWFENAQFLKIDGNWTLLVTGEGHLPYLMKMKHAGNRPEDWLRWGRPEVLQIPEERFNTNNRANAAALADWRTYDGYFYLLYAGRTEGVTHAGRGDNKLGLARSKDLIHWETP